MEKNELKITISGGPNIGKSRTLYLLKKVLKERGFNVHHLMDRDHKTEEEFDKIYGESFGDLLNCLDDISTKTEITMEEVLDLTFLTGKTRKRRAGEVIS